MQCAICWHGFTQPGTVTVTLQQGDSLIIFKQVNAEVCDNCGEYYLSEAVTQKLLQRAAEAVQNGAEVEILRFAA
ncbi:MAG: type II toxin-antitoxin system MqsA family antitoxin [Desulfobacca sp.]|uniref:type II toxin-antitoxin system MqsA family antitoxin n=1 Tax=Desulfobacca sp. TaxID=2067990 RepID=UPI00404B591D